MPTITEFLEARIAEDEAEAKTLPVWFNPPKLLAECAAKRAILELHVEYTYTDDEPGFSMQMWECMCNSQALKPCSTVATLAAVYADHPDYQQEWAL